MSNPEFRISGKAVLLTAAAFLVACESSSPGHTETVDMIMSQRPEVPESLLPSSESVASFSRQATNLWSPESRTLLTPEQPFINQEELNTMVSSLVYYRQALLESQSPGPDLYLTTVRAYHAAILGLHSQGNEQAQLVPELATDFALFVLKTSPSGLNESQEQEVADITTQIMSTLASPEQQESLLATISEVQEVNQIEAQMLAFDPSIALAEARFAEYQEGGGSEYQTLGEFINGQIAGALRDQYQRLNSTGRYYPFTIDQLGDAQLIEAFANNYAAVVGVMYGSTLASQVDTEFFKQVALKEVFAPTLQEYQSLTRQHILECLQTAFSFDMLRVYANANLINQTLSQALTPQEIHLLQSELGTQNIGELVESDVRGIQNMESELAVQILTDLADRINQELWKMIQVSEDDRPLLEVNSLVPRVFDMDGGGDGETAMVSGTVLTPEKVPSLLPAIFGAENFVPPVLVDDSGQPVGPLNILSVPSLSNANEQSPLTQEPMVFELIDGLGWTARAVGDEEDYQTTGESPHRIGWGGFRINLASESQEVRGLPPGKEFLWRGCFLAVDPEDGQMYPVMITGTDDDLRVHSGATIFRLGEPAGGPGGTRIRMNPDGSMTVSASQKTYLLASPELSYRGKGSATSITQIMSAVLQRYISTRSVSDTDLWRRVSQHAVLSNPATISDAVVVPRATNDALLNPAGEVILTQDVPVLAAVVRGGTVVGNLGDTPLTIGPEGMQVVRDDRGINSYDTVVSRTPEGALIEGVVQGPTQYIGRAEQMVARIPEEHHELREQLVFMINQAEQDMVELTSGLTGLFSSEDPHSREVYEAIYTNLRALVDTGRFNWDVFELLNEELDPNDTYKQVLRENIETYLENNPSHQAGDSQSIFQTREEALNTEGVDLVDQEYVVVTQVVIGPPEDPNFVDRAYSVLGSVTFTDIPRYWALLVPADQVTSIPTMGPVQQYGAEIGLTAATIVAGAVTPTGLLNLGLSFDTLAAAAAYWAIINRLTPSNTSQELHYLDGLRGVQN